MYTYLVYSGCAKVEKLKDVETFTCYKDQGQAKQFIKAKVKQNENTEFIHENIGGPIIRCT